MGVKSTTTLTRQAAEDKYVEMKTDRARAKAYRLSNSQLEAELERLNDKAVDELTGTPGGGFDNYLIQE